MPISRRHDFVDGELIQAEEFDEEFNNIVSYINQNLVTRDNTQPFTQVPSGPGIDPTSPNQLVRKAYVDNRFADFVGADNKWSASIQTHINFDQNGWFEAAAVTVNVDYSHRYRVVANVASLGHNQAPNRCSADAVLERTLLNIPGQPSTHIDGGFRRIVRDLIIGDGMFMMGYDATLPPGSTQVKYALKFKAVEPALWGVARPLFLGVEDMGLNNK